MKPTIHFHLGVDTSEIVVASQLNGLSSNSNVYFGNHLFQKFLGPAISCGATDEVAKHLEGLPHDASGWFFSRPLFLYTGCYLNQDGAIKKSRYKLSTVLDLFDNFTTVVHLVLESHVSYLSRHIVNAKTKLPPNADFSWKFIIDEILSITSSKALLVVWDSSQNCQFRDDFENFVFSGSERMRHARRLELDFNARLAIVEQAGYDPVDLGQRFADDISYLRSATTQHPAYPTAYICQL